MNGILSNETIMEYNIKEGDIVDVTISSIKDFGAFADFGEGSGLIYFNQIVPKVEYGNISSVLSVGQKAKCKVVQLKPDGKVALTMNISATNQKKQSRKQIIETVKEDIKEMDSDDTSIRSIWKNLTDIQHYMLMYMQGNIPLRKGSAKIDSKSNTLIAEIDTSLHFQKFKKEVRRVFDSDVYKHPILPNYWYFESDVDLYSLSDRINFSETSGHMYVVMGENPVIEIKINADNDESKKTIIERLQAYYPQMELLLDNDSGLYFSLPYKNRAELNDYNVELSYALSGIRNGIQDELEDANEDSKHYEAASFNYEILEIEDGHDKFLLTQNPEALMDEEGLRFSSFKGQNFIIPDGECEIQVGILNKIEYPKISFRLRDESFVKLYSIINAGERIIVAPDMDDMTGEIEKINRLRDSFDKITEHPEALSNPRLSSYLFDASKATKLSQESIDNRVLDIKNNQLNLNLNESQVNAIAKAVEAQDLSIIQGPPGTGKSTAIAELIWQLARKNPKGRILLTSEANLAVDNALDKLKSSNHNIVKPIRIAAGDKFSAEGLSYSIIEMKKWVGIELNDMEKEDDALVRDTDEYRSFNTKSLVLNRWMMNIFSRSKDRLHDETIQKQWFDILYDLPSTVKKKVFDEYRTHCNVIGATCSAITDKNYSATQKYGKYIPSRFIKKYWSVYKTNVNAQNPKLTFDVVIQDEASKATPAELSLPLSYGKKAIVIGDHRQLPPNLDKEDILFKLHMQRLKSKSREERDSIYNLEQYVRKHFDVLEKSHFERLFRQIDSSLKGTFNTQYRMHQDINDVIYQFYVEENGLKCGVSDSDRQHGINIPGFISPNNHVIWIDTNSPEVRDGTSRANKGEVETVKWVLENLSLSESFKEYQKSQKTDEDREIGLITFYGSQMKRLRSVVDIAVRKGLHIKMSSVDRFQGMERNIIIVSMVRSNLIAKSWKEKPDFRSYPEKGYAAQKDLGFAKSPNRLNVALSRVKTLLIIVGNSEHFSSYVDTSGRLIYKNVYDTISQNPNGHIISRFKKNDEYDKVFKIRKVPMPTNRSVNLNTRDINVTTDKNLRATETWLTNNSCPVDNPHFAVLELSTKAVKLLYAHSEQAVFSSSEFNFKNFVPDGRKTETGKGLDDQNVMDMDFFRARVLPVICNMKRVMKREGIDVVYSVATAAYRTAKNREEIIECIKSEADINVRILSKKEESVATMFAYGISTKYKKEIQESSHTIMIDQGGGSTEVSVFNQGDLIGSYSINLGTTALRNMLTNNITEITRIQDALKKSDQMIRERMVAFINNLGDVMQSEKESFCVSVGTAITKATGKSKNAVQHDTIITYESLSQKIENLTAKILEQFDTVGDLINWEQRMISDSMDRFLTMRMGLPMYLILMEKFNIKSIHVCGTGLWYGIYLQHLFNVAD
ncbi:MAG: AAA family ATPase [Bacteroidaceae bacterium]|nr:AAA family ATPase [Bacteroidaceae bacterium]